MATSERWLSVEEIAQHLGVSKESIYRLLERGKIPAHRVGRLWKFQISEIDSWVRNDSAGQQPEDNLTVRSDKDG